MLELRDGTRKNDKCSITHMDLHKPNNKLVSANLNTFGARMSHGQTQIHKTHHGLDLREATTFPIIVYYVPFHGGHIQMAYCPGTPKWEFRNSLSWDSRNFVCKPSIAMNFLAKL